MTPNEKTITNNSIDIKQFHALPPSVNISDSNYNVSYPE